MQALLFHPQLSFLVFPSIDHITIRFHSFPITSACLISIKAMFLRANYTTCFSSSVYNLFGLSCFSPGRFSILIVAIAGFDFPRWAPAMQGSRMRNSSPWRCPYLMMISGFTARQLDPYTWAIKDHGHDTLYLLAGDEYALLVDTGWGLGDLPALIRQLTRLPLIVIHTHGHPDHALGSGAFSQVYIHPLDEGLYHSCFQPAVRTALLAHLEDIIPSTSSPSWPPRRPQHIIPVGEGDLFDLGGRVIEVIDTPGHTRGSICLLDRSRRWLFSGDSLLSGRVWMHLNESTSLRTYARTLARLEAMSPLFDAVLSGHAPLDTLPQSRSLLVEQIEGVAAVLEGRLTGLPEHTFAGAGLALDFGQTGLLYHPDRIESIPTGILPTAAE
jgi:hydroxyacylglutathione hydrolase